MRVRNKVQRAVLGWWDAMHDASYIPGVFAEFGDLPVLRAGRDLLVSGDRAVIWRAMDFLRQFRFSSADDALRSRFYRAAPRYFAPRLRRLLRNEDHLTRSFAIYTIGQLRLYAEAKALRAAFPWFVEHDPLALPGLLVELGWLHDARGVSARMKQIVRHRDFVVRWTAFGYFTSVGVGKRGPYRRERVELLNQLEQDEVPAIAAEARYELDELLREARAPAPKFWGETICNGESSVARRPALTYDALEIGFHNRLHERNQRDYTPAEFAAYARERGAFVPQPARATKRNGRGSRPGRSRT